MTDGQGRQQARAAIEMGSPAEPRAVAAERVDGSRRVATIVVAFALTLAALSAVIVHWTWAVGVSAGRDLFPYRMVLAQTEPSRGPVDLVWLGDSTITSLPSRTSYADTLLRTFAPHDVRTALVAWPGLDFFGYYAVMPRILALQPRVLVMIANFRLFARTGWAYTDLLGSMPLGEVPRLWTLPYDRRGTSAAEMLLARALRWPAVTNAMFYVQGVRGIADRLPIRNDLGPAVPEMPTAR